MTDYRYFATDLISDRTLAELPLRDVSFDLALNAAGNWSGTLSMTRELAQMIDPNQTTSPGKTALWIERDGILVFGGIVWSRRYKSADTSFEIGGADFYSYLQHRHLEEDRDYTGWSLFDAAEDLIEYAREQPSGDIGIVVDRHVQGSMPPAREFIVDRYEYAELSKLIEDFADTEESGFDFAMDVRWNGNRREKLLSLHYPQRGRERSNTPLIFDDANILSYEWPEDGTEIVNRAYLTGAGEGEDMLRTRLTNFEAHGHGMPLLSDVFAYKEVKDRQVLNELAHRAIDTYEEANPEVSLTVRPDVEPQFGTYRVGDWAQIEIEDPRFPRGIVVRQRITGISVTPPQDDAVEQISLKLSGPQERIRW